MAPYYFGRNKSFSVNKETICSVHRQYSHFIVSRRDCLSVSVFIFYSPVMQPANNVDMQTEEL